MRFLKILGWVFAISFVFNLFIGGDVKEEDLGKVAKEKVQEQLKEDPELKKVKILDVHASVKKNFINGKTMGLPQDDVYLVDVEVKTKQTTNAGIESEQSYYLTFIQLKGDDEWKFGREWDSGTGTASYELEDL
jgi:hypothetical protein